MVTRTEWASSLPMPRVLLASEWFVKYTAGLARGLADLGCNVLLLTRDHDLEFGGEVGAMREFVRTTLGDGPAHLELGGRVREVRRLGEVARLRRRCADWGPDVVHVQDSLPHDLRLALAAGFPRRRYALTVHDPVPHPGDPVPTPWIRFVRRRLRRNAALLFVHSAAIGERLRAAGDVRGALEVVPHGFGEVAVAPLPASTALLFFGRISHYKGVDVLLDAMEPVWARRPETTLTIAGAGELPAHPALADPRVALRKEHVPEAELPALFAAATCVVLPYREASQSGVGSEAKRFGRPIVATRVGGLPELVPPSCGRLVPSEDADALAEAVLEVVETPGLAAELGRGGAASVAESGWREVAAKTLTAYRRELF